MIGREEGLETILCPLDRSAAVDRGEGDQEILRVELAANAEAAADIVFDHGDRINGHGELAREHRPDGKRHLGCAVHREVTTRSVVVREQPTRLQWESGVTLNPEILGPHVGGRRERRICFAHEAAQCHCYIVLALGEQRHVPGACSGHPRHWLDRLDFDADKLRSVFRDRARVGQ